MTYEVEFARSAGKELQKLPPDTSKRILKAIVRLQEDSRVGSVRPMVGSKSWRLRVGDYRIIYDIHDDRLVILVLRA